MLNKLYIAILIFVSLLSISAVAAGDNSTLTDLSDETDSIENETLTLQKDCTNFNDDNISNALSSDAEVDDDVIIHSQSDNLSQNNTFNDLSYLINNTPQNQTLTLDRDYKFVNGSDSEIMISNPIIIDGKGHTLDAGRLSRIFNITADNVTIKNINFINGRALGSYVLANAGGGAIYWYGNNGVLDGCNFTNNAGIGVDNLFKREGNYTDEKGRTWFFVRPMPLGVKINEGGAVVWNGTHGSVLNCKFINNSVGYPNSGGAISWRGDYGKIFNSEFYNNSAFTGSQIFWLGNFGEVTYSKFTSCLSLVFNKAIYWGGCDGVISESVIFSPFNSVFGNVSAENNWWGDYKNVSHIKYSGAVNYYVLNITSTKYNLIPGDVVVIKGSLGRDVNISTDLYFNGELIKLVNGSFEFTYTSKATGFLDISMILDNIILKVVPLTKITDNKNITKYYSSSTKFKVKVYGQDGKLAVGEKVKFRVNNKNYYVKSDSHGIASLKLNFKPGNYIITTCFKNVKVKNRIVIKSILKSKSMVVKYKKPFKFKVKVLNSKGKAFKNRVVKIKFKSKFYKIKTASNGVAVFKCNKKLNAGKHSIKVYYKRLVNSNKIIIRKYN